MTQLDRIEQELKAIRRILKAEFMPGLSQFDRLMARTEAHQSSPGITGEACEAVNVNYDRLIREKWVGR